MIPSSVLLIALGQIALAPPSPARAGQAFFELSPPVVEFESMEYPAVARAAGVSGILVLSLALDPDGRVASVSTLPAVPQVAQLLGPDAERNVRTWRFVPGGAGRRVTVAYAFDLDGPFCGKDRPRSTFELRARSLALVVACQVPLGG
jgi:TonB family protein